MTETTSFSGAALRRIRHKKGWSQAELARRAGVRERQIIRWENNQNEPRLEAIGLLAQATSESIDAFFSGSENGAITEEEDESEMSADLLVAVRQLARALSKVPA